METIFKQAGIHYDANTCVSLVADSTSIGINYIVDTGSDISEFSSNVSDSEMSVDNAPIESSSQTTR